MKARAPRDPAGPSYPHSKPSKLRADGTRLPDPEADLDRIIFQALVNEGTHLKFLNSKRPQLTYNEKEIREAAHAEVAQTCGISAEPDKSGKKRKNLDNEERLKQSRDRNREHAKYTRLRKKAYVNKLKELLDKMKAVNDVEEAERHTYGQKIYRMDHARKEVVRQFLECRGSNCRDRETWAALVEEDFELTLPITPYRSFPRSEIQGCNRVVRGLRALLADTCSLALMAESVGFGSSAWQYAVKRNAACRFEYHIEPSDLLVAGELVMCRYSMHLVNGEAVGAAGACVQHGMLQCRFRPHTQRLQAAEFTFDVMGFMQQLQTCWGITPERSIVPNTLEAAMQPSKEAQAILTAAAPHSVLHVNDSWRQLLGSNSLGPDTDTALLQAVHVYAFQRDLLGKLASDCAAGVPGSAIFLSHRQHQLGQGQRMQESDGESTAVVNRSSDSPPVGGPVVYYLKLLPLISDTDSITHLQATLVELPLTAEESRAAAQRAAVLSQHPSVLAQAYPRASASATAGLPQGGKCGESGWRLFSAQQQQQRCRQWHPAHQPQWARPVQPVLQPDHQRGACLCRILLWCTAATVAVLSRLSGRVDAVSHDVCADDGASWLRRAFSATHHLGGGHGGPGGGLLVPGGASE